MYVVEVSNPRLANDSAYERWTVESKSELAIRLEDLTGWRLAECQDAAREIGDGESFEHVDEESGRTVTAWRNAPVGATA